jgi:hypothetical protein
MLDHWPIRPVSRAPLSPWLPAAVPIPYTAAACSHLPLSCSLPSLLYLSSPLLHPSAQDARAQAEPRTQADPRTWREAQKQRPARRAAATPSARTGRAAPSVHFAYNGDLLRPLLPPHSPLH